MIPRWDAFLRSFWVINAIRSSRRRYKSSFAINIKLSNISSRNWPHLRVCQSVWLLVNYELLSQRPNWEYSTVQYSTGSWYLFIDIIMLTRDARIRFNLKKNPFCVILLCGHYHGIITMDTEISLYCELENSVCWLTIYLETARAFTEKPCFFSLYYLPKEWTLVITLRCILFLESYFRWALHLCAFFHEGYLFSTLWLF